MRLLVLTPTLPHPPIWGFNIRVSQLVRHLASKHEVTLLSYEGPHDSAARQALGNMCTSIVLVPALKRSMSLRRFAQVRATMSVSSFHLHRFYSQEMQTALTKILHDVRPDLVQIESSAMAMFDFGNAPVVLDEHNLEYELLQRTAAIEESRIRRLHAGLESRKVKKEEAAVWRRVDGCVLTSTREQAIVNAAEPDLPTAVVPNGVDLDYFRPKDAAIKPGSLVFTGLLTYRPNADGASHFVRAIFPSIVAARPDATFTAVGWGLPDDLRSLLGERISHTGRVDDVRPYLASAAVVVVPLRIGSGTRLKVLEALAMGKAVVTTRVGCEGLDVNDGDHLLIADEPDEFASAVVRLLDSPAEADRLGRRGRARVESRYGWAESARGLDRFHESLRRAPVERLRVAAAGR
jgi:sugar transferase (PEP-CTERM/EpsH1 system associated)